MIQHTIAVPHWKASDSEVSTLFKYFNYCYYWSVCAHTGAHANDVRNYTQQGWLLRTVTKIGQLNPTLLAHLQMLFELFQNHPGSCQDGQEMKAA